MSGVTLLTLVGVAVGMTIVGPLCIVWLDRRRDKNKWVPKWWRY